MLAIYDRVRTVRPEQPTRPPPPQPATSPSPSGPRRRSQTVAATTRPATVADDANERGATRLGGPANSGDEPSLEELTAAVQALQNTAPGQNGLHPRGLKEGGAGVATMLHRVVTAVWRAGTAPAAWRQALLTPLPKKGSRLNVGNFRRISLIDVESKAYLLIVLDRIRTHLDRCFLDEQHGFRPERGPGDGQFCLRRLVEVASAHAVPVYAGFVDFKQAFDSLDRETLWAMLKAYGVHPKLVALIQDLYQGTTARVRANGFLSDTVPFHSGVRQGCPLSPTLFNVYMDFVARILLRRCQERGIPGFQIAYNIPGEGVRPAAGGVRDLAMLLYADDLVLLAPSLEALTAALDVLEEVAAEWGLTINHDKTEVMIIQPPARQPQEQHASPPQGQQGPPQQQQRHPQTQGQQGPSQQQHHHPQPQGQQGPPPQQQRQPQPQGQQEPSHQQQRHPQPQGQQVPSQQQQRQPQPQRQPEPSRQQQRHPQPQGQQGPSQQQQRHHQPQGQQGPSQQQQRQPQPQRQPEPSRQQQRHPQPQGQQRPSQQQQRHPQLQGQQGPSQQQQRHPQPQGQHEPSQQRQQQPVQQQQPSDIRLASGSRVKVVNHFKYLGIMFDSNGSQNTELQRRICNASYAFRQLHPVLQARRGPSLQTKMLMYKTFVFPVLTYGGPETWALSAQQLQSLETAHNTFLRRITHQRRGPDGISNLDLYQLTYTASLAHQLEDRRLRRLGHIVRRGDGALVKQLLFASGLPHVVRPVGRPRRQWMDGAQRSLSRLGLLDSWLTLAGDRDGWSKVCARVYD